MSKLIMDWFKELSLIEKIETYAELLYDMGTCSSAKKEERENFLAEKKMMLDIIKKDVEKRIK